MVAERNMADYTGAILIEPPYSASGLQTFKIAANGAYLKPGYACTDFNEALGTCDIINSGDTNVIGIVLDSTDAPMDTLIPIGTTVTVAMVGSGALVYSYFNADVDILYTGKEMRAMDNDTGQVGANHTSALRIGRNTEHSPADTGYYRPIKLRLSS